MPRRFVIVLVGLVSSLALVPLASGRVDRAEVCGGVPDCVVPVTINYAGKGPLKAGSSVASWRVRPTIATPCATVSAWVTVTGRNPGSYATTQTWVNDGYYPSYTGAKAGTDSATISVSVSGGCGYGPYTVQYLSPRNYAVGWGTDAQTFGHCTGAQTLKSVPVDHVGAFSCDEEPVDGGFGTFQEGVTDATLPSPGVPFEFRRVYTSGDTRSGDLGNGWHDPYDARLIPSYPDASSATIQFGSGQQPIFAKQPDGSYVSPSWMSATLSYSTSSSLYTLTQSDQTKWTFNSSGYLTAISKSGQTLTVSQYPSGNPNRVTLSNGKIITFTYDANYRMTQLTLPDGRNVKYGYDASGNLTSVTDLRGGVTYYTYNSQNRLLTIKDPNGNVVLANVYGSDGGVSQQADALGHATTYVRADFCFGALLRALSARKSGSHGRRLADGGAACVGGGRLTSTDPRGHDWVQTFTPEGLLSSSTDPLGNQSTYGYDSSGSDLSPGDPVSYTDPLGSTVTSTFDANHNRTQVLLPGGISTSATYDTQNRMITATNGRGYTTSYTYDSNGNPTLVTQPDGGTIGLGYNAAGQITSLTNQANKTYTYGYDATGNRISATTPLGNRTTYGYDTSGRLTSIVDPRGNVTGANPNDYKTTIAYNAADQVTSVTDPNGHVTTYGYDADGNLTSRTDPNNHTWTYTYNAANELTKVTAPDLMTTTYGYDAVGNVISRTDANNHTTTYGYDAANRLTDITDPLNRHWTLSYDADSNVIAVTTPSGGTITYGYDTLGRRTSASYSDGTSTVSYTYDADGNRTSMTDGAGTVNYTYDQLDQLTAATRGTDTFSYTYDPVGRIASRTYPDSTATSYVYDNDGELSNTSTGAATAGYLYDPAGDLTLTTLPNGVAETYAYDHSGRLTQLVDGFRTFTYGYDAAGNVSSRGVAGTTTTYGFDSLDRLTDIATGASTIHYGYDNVGNRITTVDGSGTTTAAYDAADQLQTLTGPSGTTSYGFDANGNETTAGPWSFSFNLAGQLIGAQNGSTSVAYTYDGNGNRITSTAGGQTDQLLWDTGFRLPQLALERDSSGALVRRYTYGNERVSMTTPQTTAYYSTDSLGSVTELSGGSGTQLGQYDNQPFGDGATSTNVDPSVTGNPFDFTGEYQDSKTGLYDLRARQYDPTTSRFFSPDPLGAQDASSSYTYVADNPLGYTDPSGMKRQNTCASLWCWIKSDPQTPPTVGGCVGGNAVVPFIHVVGMGSLCIVLSSGCGNGFHIGGTATIGGGVTSTRGGGFSGSGGVLGSTACTPSQLGRFFNECGASAGDGLQATATYARGSGVTSVYVGGGPGETAGAFCGRTYTWTRG